jgi:glycosyltransferase involved in cell wall biosynthesis
MVSIIIPTYNRAVLLKKALASVFDQCFEDFEVIVVDDASQDDTESVVKSFAGGIKYIRHKHRRGAGAARNTGIKNSTGDFIAFLDSDDWWDKNKLAVQAEAMLREPDSPVSHTDEVWYRGGAFLNQKKIHAKQGGDIFERCLKLCVVSMSTVMVRRELFKDAGYFDETLPCCEDYDLWLRVSARHSFLFIAKPLTFKDGGREDQVSYVFRRGMDRFRIHSLERLIKSGILNRRQLRLALEELETKARIYGNGCIKHGRPEEGNYYLSLPYALRGHIKNLPSCQS